MSFISLAPYLKSERGHDLIYHQLVESVVKSTSMTFEVYLSAECPLDLPPHYTKYFKRTKRGFFGTLSRYREFKQLLHTLKAEKRTFFLESFQLRDLCGLTLALLASGKKEDRLLLLFRNRPDTTWKKKIAHNLLLKLLSKKLRTRLILLTDSALILPHLPEPHFLLPIPHTDMGEASHQKKEKITLFWPGAPRAAKGLKEIQRLLEIDDEAAKNFELVVSEDAPLQPKNALTLCRTKKSLDRKEYLAAIHKADIFLLPYDPKTYQSGTSGIFVEAIIADKIPLVKEGSWLSYEAFENNLSELIVNWEDPFFFTHLLQLKERQTILDKLQVMRTRYLEFHSYESFATCFRRALETNQRA